MFSIWNNITITDIVYACYVPPGGGKSVHNDRQFHGLVLNDADSDRHYIFSDGTVLKTYGNELFYLPKGSSYVVNTFKTTGCYAINFDADMLSDIPFSVKIKNIDPIIKLFRDSQSAWRKQSHFNRIQITRNLYDIIDRGEKEERREYQPKVKEIIIAPALEKIKNDFCNSDLTVAGLAGMCGITEAYFRRIFVGKYGMSPKEYIISKRINYAKKLLESGDFTVAQIANICGYGEPCHFSREFSRNVGASPSEYLKNK